MGASQNHQTTATEHQKARSITNQWAGSQNLPRSIGRNQARFQVPVTVSFIISLVFLRAFLANMPLSMAMEVQALFKVLLSCLPCEALYSSCGCSSCHFS